MLMVRGMEADVRRARCDDWSGLWPLLVAMGVREEEQPTYERFVRLIEEPCWFIVVAADGDRLVGYAAAQDYGEHLRGGKEGRVARLHDVYVDPGARGRGLGRLLMGAVTGWASDRVRTCSGRRTKPALRPSMSASDTRACPALSLTIPSSRSRSDFPVASDSDGPPGLRRIAILSVAPPTPSRPVCSPTGVSSPGVSDLEGCSPQRAWTRSRTRRSPSATVSDLTDGINRIAPAVDDTTGTVDHVTILTGGRPASGAPRVDLSEVVWLDRAVYPATLAGRTSATSSPGWRALRSEGPAGGVIVGRPVRGDVVT